MLANAAIAHDPAIARGDGRNGGERLLQQRASL